MKKIFVDGGAGTTGLRIKERLAARKDLVLMTLPEEKRKDIGYRKEYLNSADVSILCLPDDAARQAVSMIENPDAVVIDTSTAHRTDSGFVYGFPELTGQKRKIARAKRIANPGCHASGFIALVAPLVENGIIPADTHLSCFSLTGYSGGGKKMIAEYEAGDKNELLDAPGMYGLSQNHKHLPEMFTYCKLSAPPILCPTVAPYYAGMQVTVPLFASDVNCGINDIKELYSSYYSGDFIYYKESGKSTLYAGEFSGFDDMQITVCGNSDRILLISQFDNLGKGASGAAIQNLNICLGLDESAGLKLKRDYYEQG